MGVCASKQKKAKQKVEQKPSIKENKEIQTSFITESKDWNEKERKLSVIMQTSKEQQSISPNKSEIRRRQFIIPQRQPENPEKPDYKNSILEYPDFEDDIRQKPRLAQPPANLIQESDTEQGAIVVAPYQKLQVIRRSSSSRHPNSTIQIRMSEYKRCYAPWQTPSNIKISEKVEENNI